MSQDYQIVESTDTRLVQTFGATAINALFPGLNLPETATREEIEAVYLTSQEYTAAELADKEMFLSYTRRSPDGKMDKVLTVLPVWGIFAQFVDIVDKSTGETSRQVRIILKIIQTDKDGNDLEPVYIDFVSTVVAKDIFRMLQTGIRSLGDWDIPLYATIKRFALPIGQSYRIQFVNPATIK